jgi:hypothetical protein
MAFEKMLYLLDANVLITASNTYYSVDAVPEFWEWLAHKGRMGEIKMPIETFEEVRDGGTDTEADLLYGWLQIEENRTAILLDEEVQRGLVQRVVDQYAPDLTEDEIEAIGRDPFLIAHGLAQHGKRCVVTMEVSGRKHKRQNRRIPDVCADLGVSRCNTVTMLRTLGFSTRWRG